MTNFGNVVAILRGWSIDCTLKNTALLVSFIRERGATFSVGTRAMFNEKIGHLLK